MKYKSEIIYFKDEIVDIPDGCIMVRHIVDLETPLPWGHTLPSSEKLVVLIPIKEE